MIKSLNHDVEKTLYRFLGGIFIGFFFGNRLILSLSSHKLCIKTTGFALPSWNAIGYQDIESKTISHERNIYIGMMSMDNRMDTRVQAAINTWAKKPNVKVEIFANNNGTFDNNRRYTESYLKNGIRVIQLAGISDHVYPPQKKSFSMVKFMHDMYLDKYDWFIRLDDDAYVDIDKLRTLLSRINTSKPLYLGHPGFGRDEDDYIERGENYCMGGPGMVFSNGLLRKLAPKLKHCLRNLLTAHEDVELGRCIQRVTGIKCSMSWELQKFFFQNYQQGTYADNIKTISPSELDEGIIFHANKEPEYQHNFHVMALKRKVQKLVSKVIQFEKEIRRNFRDNEDRLNLEANSYSQFRWDANLRSHSFKPNDRDMNKKMHVTLMNNLVANTNSFIKQMKKQNRFNFQKLKGVALLSSYFVVNPLFSTDVISEIDCFFTQSLSALMPRKEAKTTIYIHQRQYFPNSLLFLNEPKDIQIDNGFQKTTDKLHQSVINKEGSESYHSSTEAVTVSFLTALSGRPENFVRFISNLETMFFSQGENINLIVVYFPKPDTPTTKTSQDSEEVIAADTLNMFDKDTDTNEVNDDVKFIKENMDKLQNSYPRRLIKLVLLKPGTEFSRGVGLQLASSHVTDPKEIIFFCDVDLVFAPAILTHIRRNTIQKKQVYYPVFFSQYDPDVVYVERSNPSTPFSFEELDGFWRYFSYGMLAIYKSDFEATEGFDTSIHGWGLEDTHMVTSILGASLDIFQSPEPAQVHIYHDKYCDPGTTAKQYNDCLKSRAAHYGPKTLLYYLYKAPVEHSDYSERNDNFEQ